MNRSPMGDVRRRRNRRMGLVALAVVVGMVGLSYASVPLYNLFCRVTGYGGTTQRADIASDQVFDREVEVRFDASVSGRLPWTFAPVQRSVTVKVGETKQIFYRAQNNGDVPITGTATFNVTPQKAGPYFVKIDCFCFTEQLLGPHESIEDMAVSFYVDPDMNADPDMADVKTITLSYTFFQKDGTQGAEKGTG